jgi:Rap/ran-GAP
VARNLRESKPWFGGGAFPPPPPGTPPFAGEQFTEKRKTLNGPVEKERADEPHSCPLLPMPRPIILAPSESVYDLLGSSTTASEAFSGARSFTGRAGAYSSPDLNSAKAQEGDNSSGDDGEAADARAAGEDDEEWTDTLKEFMHVTDDVIESFVPVKELETPVVKENYKETVAAELEVASSAGVVSSRMDFWKQKDADHLASPAANRMFGQSAATPHRESFAISGKEQKLAPLSLSSSSLPRPEDSVDGGSDSDGPTSEDSPALSSSTGSSVSSPRKGKSRERSSRSRSATTTASTGSGRRKKHRTGGDSKSGRSKSSRSDRTGSPRKLERQASDSNVAAKLERQASDSTGLSTPAKSISQDRMKKRESVDIGASPGTSPRLRALLGKSSSPRRTSSESLLNPKNIQQAKNQVASAPVDVPTTNMMAVRTAPAKDLSKKVRVVLRQSKLVRVGWGQVEQEYPTDPKKVSRLPLQNHDNFTLELGRREGESEPGDLENGRKFTKVYTGIRETGPRHFLGANENGEPLIVCVAGKPRGHIGSSAELRQSGSSGLSGSGELADGEHTFDVLLMNSAGEDVLDLTVTITDEDAKSEEKAFKLVQKQLKQTLQPLSKVKLMEIGHDEIDPLIINYEHALIPRGFKCGVLYCKKGQVSENDMFRNAKASSRFAEFLEMMGERVQLKGMEGFTGGLDTRNDSTGTHAYVTTFEDIRCIFHVSTELPMYESDEQQLERKRHLGNDIVVIVFNEDAEPFDPATVKSEFNHVFCVVNPLKAAKGSTSSRRRFRLSFAYKLGCNVPAPLLPERPIFECGEDLRTYLMTKLINAERAALEAPVFFNKLRQTRALMLKALISELAHKK